MKSARKCAAAAVIAVFVSAISFGAPGSGAAAQTGGTFVQGNVTGKAVDASGNPQAGKTVQIFDKNGKLITTTTTGTDGSFSLNSLLSGDYTMVIGNISAPLSVVPLGAAGAATAFEVVLAGSSGVGAGVGVGVGTGLALGQWAIIGGVVVLAGAVAVNVNKKEDKKNTVSP